MASNPATFDCAAGTWVKVGTAITTGTLYILNRTPAKYVQTYRVAADPAPTTLDDAAEITEPAIGISYDTAVDFYVMAIGAAGKVRIDL